MPRKKAPKSRVRRRKKTKYLSLSLELSSEKVAQVPNIRRQLNLNQNPPEDESLAALLGLAQDSETMSLPVTYDISAQDSDNLSHSLNYASVAQDNSEEIMVRAAMRGNKDNMCEEKWVCYEEVTSCSAGDEKKVKVYRPGLSLKLDYQEIIDAWCDKGPLYMEGPQTVPDLLFDDFLSCGTSNGSNDGWTSNGALWTVPENTVGNGVVKGEVGLEEELKIQHREASVLRYKEKRQNRLFSKRIRYEVRKINAEKRPRMKGRFVKRS